MNFKSTENFYIIETILDDNQYLCEYVTDETTKNIRIMGTTRDIYDGRMRKFKDLEEANEVKNRLKNSEYSNEPRVLKLKLEVSIEEA